MESKIVVPATGEKISVDAAGKLVVPNNPIIPFIEGDGIGVDVTPAMLKVVDAAVEKAYKGEKKISWMEIYTGEKSTKVYGDDVWLPAETLDAMREYHVGIKGPLTTPVGGGIRSLNVALRQELDLYVCLRPVRYYEGTPSPVKQPELTDMVIFRENAEDIYAGIEWKADSAEAKKVIDFLQNEMGVKKIRFPENCGIGIKPMSEAGTKRLVRAALEYVIDNDRDSLTLVHKGNIMKFTEGAFKLWGYELAQEEYAGQWVSEEEAENNPGKLIIRDRIADNMFQQVLTRPAMYSVIAAPNLNGDYISDALAAQVGGLGLAPGVNMSDTLAFFEATHGTAPKYVGKDTANPGSLILSGAMLLEHAGWPKACALVHKAMARAIAAKTVPGDLARQMDNAKTVGCSEFGDILGQAMD